LRGREADIFAECVDGIGKSGVGRRRQHLGADEIDVGVGHAGEFLGHRVRRKQRCADIDTDFIRDATCDLELLQFIREVEAVAGFDLDGRHAFGGQCLEPGTALARERVRAGGARCAHGRRDAAAGTRDVRIARAMQPRLEFMRAIARVHEVRVAIDEPG